MNELLLNLIEFCKNQSPEMWELATQRATLDNPFWGVGALALICLGVAFVAFLADVKSAGFALVILGALMGVVFVESISNVGVIPSDSVILLEYVNLLISAGGGG